MIITKDTVALVTGASSGIGKGIAQRLAARGAHVISVGRNRQALDEIAAETGGTAVQADVTKLEELEALAERIARDFGKLDLLVNNAGIGPSARLADMTPADWKWILDANLWSVINGVTAFLPLMRTNPAGGHIVNTSSVNGMMTFPGLGAYSTTKYAVVALSETLAWELEQDGGLIKVSVFLPGPVKSSIHLSTRNRPASDLPTALNDTILDELDGLQEIVLPWMEASDAADMLISGIEKNNLYIWTHPQMTAPIIGRHAAIEESIKTHEREFPSQ